MAECTPTHPALLLITILTKEEGERSCSFFFSRFPGLYGNESWERRFLEDVGGDACTGREGGRGGRNRKFPRKAQKPKCPPFTAIVWNENSKQGFQSHLFDTLTMESTLAIMDNDLQRSTPFNNVGKREEGGGGCSTEKWNTPLYYG